jgi:M-phase inducer tyrosine phosphatase
MDDPDYNHERDADMHNFRRGKWHRTQSYTYGQSSTGISSFPSLQPTADPAAVNREHRKTAPSGGPAGSGSMFAAADVARGRRTLTAKGLCTLEEDASSSGIEDGESFDLHDSPCPPSKAVGRLSSLGSNKPARVSLDRAASFSLNSTALHRH